MNPKTLGILGGVALLAVLFWPSGSSKKVERLYNEAEELFSQADYDRAIKGYNEALEESTKWGVKTEVIDRDFYTLAHYKIAVSYSKWAEQTGDVNYYDTAVKQIEKVAADASVPKHQEGLTYLWGHILYKQEKYELSEPKFEALIETFPNSLFVENAWYAIGQLNYKLQKYEESRHAFKEVIDGFPNSDFKDDAQHLIAQSFLNEKNYEQSYQEFDKLATEEFKNYPELQAEAMYKAAFCLNQLARDEEAIGRYTTFITKFPDSQYVTAAYFDMGTIYAKQRDYDNARVNYELALQNTEDRDLQAEIQVAIGRTYYDQEDYPNAIASYNKLLEEYPESQFLVEGKLGIADSYFELENWNEAVAAFQRVLDEHPDRTDIQPYVTYHIGESHYELADNLRNSGQTDQANEYFETALGWYQKVIDEFPTDAAAPHALYGAIWALNDLGRKDELEKLAREFIDKHRTDPEFDILAAEVQLQFAWMKFKDFKQYEAAAAEYAKLWDYPELPKFHKVKLDGKSQEASAYYEASKPADYREGDPEAVFNETLLQKSVNAYQQAIDKFKDEAFLGGVEEGRYDDLAERPQKVEACKMNQALAYEKLNQWDDARRLYASIPTGSDNYEQAQLLIAQSHAREGNPSQAVATYQSILDSLSADNRSLAEIKLADLLRSEGRFTEAAVQYESIVARNPKGEFADDAQYLIGLCYYKAANDDPVLLGKSVSAFQKVVAQYGDSPNAVEAYYGLVLAHRDLAKQGDASQWPKVLEVADLAAGKYGSSDDEKIRRTLGHIDLVKATAIEKQGIDSEEEMAEHVASLRRITNNTAAPEDARSRAQLKIGHSFYSAGDHEKALAEYQMFVDMFPNNELLKNALYQISVCYYQIGQGTADESTKKLALQNSTKYAMQAVEKNPSVDAMISAYYTLGLAKYGLDDLMGAIEAFQQTTAYEGQTEDEARQHLIHQAHTRLAELNTSVGNHAAAVKEYQRVIQHTDDSDLKGRSYFAMAYAQDEHLKEYSDALLNYQNAIQFVGDALVKAQSYYRTGLIYETKLEELENALQAYEVVTTDFTNESDENIRAMVADAGIRKSDLYVKLGRLDDAIAQALKARQAAQTVPQKVSAQYNLGYLYFERAYGLFSDQVGADMRPYIEGSREAATAYLEAHGIASPIEKADKSVIPFIQNALFQAGQISYSVGSQIRLAEDPKVDLETATKTLTLFMKYADKGIFPASKDLTDNIKTALTYIGSAYFELGRVQLGLDAEYSDQTIAYFEQAVPAFKELVRRFPKEEKAPLWQFQAGESNFAAQKFLQAIDEYGKVRALNPKHPKAAESLNAITSSYSSLARDAGDDTATKEKWNAKSFEINEILAKNYPSTPYAARAFINLGHDYFNQGSVEDIDNAERIRLYDLAVEQYRRALKVPGIDQESKSSATGYLAETEAELARFFYIQSDSNFDKAKLTRGDAQKPALEKVIAEFNDIINHYPNTKFGDLSHVQIGEAYMVLADQDDNYYNDAIDWFDKLWKKYEAEPPTSTQVNRAVTRAQQQIASITSYMEAEGIPRRTGSGGSGE